MYTMSRANPISLFLLSSLLLLRVVVVEVVKVARVGRGAVDDLWSFSVVVVEEDERDIFFSFFLWVGSLFRCETHTQ